MPGRHGRELREGGLAATRVAHPFLDEVGHWLVEAEQITVRHRGTGQHGGHGLRHRKGIRAAFRVVGREVPLLQHLPVVNHQPGGRTELLMPSHEVRRQRGLVVHRRYRPRLGRARLDDALVEHRCIVDIRRGVAHQVGGAKSAVDVLVASHSRQGRNHQHHGQQTLQRCAYDPLELRHLTLLDCRTHRRIRRWARGRANCRPDR